MKLELNHGKGSVILTDTLITVTPIGAFNEYGARSINAKIREKIARLDGKSFCILYDTRALQGITPEAFDEAEVLNKWLLTQNMLANATVSNSTVTTAIIEKYSPTKKMHNQKNFTNIDDALSWLKSETTIA